MTGISIVPHYWLWYAEYCYKCWGKWLHHLCQLPPKKLTTQIICYPFEDLKWYYYLTRNLEDCKASKFQCLIRQRIVDIFTVHSNTTTGTLYYPPIIFCACLLLYPFVIIGIICIYEYIYIYVSAVHLIYS